MKLASSDVQKNNALLIDLNVFQYKLCHIDSEMVVACVF